MVVLWVLVVEQLVQQLHLLLSDINGNLQLMEHHLVIFLGQPHRLIALPLILQLLLGSEGFHLLTMIQMVTEILMSPFLVEI